ncbi:hypothetical protein [Bernardetia sp.]|uniref:hypothetical protein n=1 Tax=Bernardetia sp. TaxID=1937974 RepID=UPI0025B8522C|nr:hypothetical protein [Bernardetia sp.]
MDTSFVEFSGESDPYIQKKYFDSIAPCMTSLKYKEVYFTQEHTGDSMIVIIVERGTRIEFFPNTTRNQEVKTHTMERVKIKDHWYLNNYFW